MSSSSAHTQAFRVIKIPGLEAGKGRWGRGVGWGEEEVRPL